MVICLDPLQRFFIHPATTFVFFRFSFFLYYINCLTVLFLFLNTENQVCVSIHPEGSLKEKFPQVLFNMKSRLTQRLNEYFMNKTPH